MLKRYQHVVGGAFRVVDAAVVGASWLTAYHMRFKLPWIEVTKGFPDFQQYASLTPLVVLEWLVIFGMMRVYSSQRLLRRTHEVLLLLRAQATALVLFLALTYMFSEYKYSRAVILYFGICSTLSLIGLRVFLRNLLRWVRKRGFNLRHALLIGEGPAVETLIQRLDKFLEIGVRVQGVVVAENSAFSASATKDQNILGHPVVGTLQNLPEILKQFRPDRLIISLPRNQYAELDRVLRALKDETCDIHLVPDLHEFVTLGCEIEDFDGLPLVNINGSPLQGWGLVAKRFTDFSVSAVALIFLSPLLILISILIKLTSRGPILYSQVRMGLDGKTFKIWKFRSMEIDAEKKSGAVWAQKEDQRRTPLGTLLRSTSLDELPQLWNILVGEMSLVGPRPERPVFVEKFKAEVPGYMLRHKVKAGLTGWAQVNGWRGNTSIDRRIECDLYYIRNWSYAFDLKIILMTFWRGFIHKNAY